MPRKESGAQQLALELAMESLAVEMRKREALVAEFKQTQERIAKLRDALQSIDRRAVA